MIALPKRPSRTSVEGLLFLSPATWAHCLDAVAEVTGIPRAALLTDAEVAALGGLRSPHGLIIGEE